MVHALMKSGDDLYAETDATKMSILHMGVGIVGEAGELIDALKKHLFYNQPLDRANVIEELGDLEFYLQGLREALNIKREDTLQANLTKLALRYKDFEYSDEAAKLRKDKL